MPFALATSSHQRHYAVKTQRHTDLFALFSHRVTGVGTNATCFQAWLLFIPRVRTQRCKHVKLATCVPFASLDQMPGSVQLEANMALAALHVSHMQTVSMEACLSTCDWLATTVPRRGPCRRPGGARQAGAGHLPGGSCGVLAAAGAGRLPRLRGRTHRRRRRKGCWHVRCCQPMLLRTHMQ